ncbi:MAG: NAD(P)H-binding protein [Chloroflexota bacterium]
MRVLVAGGTGFIGRRVVDQLVAGRRHEISVMTRNPDAIPARDTVRFVQGDVSEPNSLRAAVADAEAVIHCVQFPNHPVENSRRGWTYEAVDGAGTEHMVQACLAANVRRFIYVSGAGAGPDRVESWFKAKHRAETAVTSSGLQYVILRPSWIYGPDDRSLNKFVAFVRYLPAVPVIGSGKERVQPISVFDVARVIAASVDNGEATNRVFELGSRDALTMDEIIETVMRIVDKKKPLVHQPTWLVKIPAALLQFLPNAPLSPGAVDFITMDERVDPSAAEKVFGVTFATLEEGLRSYLRP